jgi:hypothetical protein
VRRFSDLGLADRDYMKADYRFKKKMRKKPSMYKRLMFFLWRIKKAVFRTD